MKGEFKSFVKKVVKEYVTNHSDIEERVGDLCYYIALSDRRAQPKHDYIRRRS
jgi:hypothetical protein